MHPSNFDKDRLVFRIIIDLIIIPTKTKVRKFFPLLVFFPLLKGILNNKKLESKKNLFTIYFYKLEFYSLSLYLNQRGMNI